MPKAMRWYVTYLATVMVCCTTALVLSPSARTSASPQVVAPAVATPYTLAPQPSGGDDTVALQAALAATPTCNCLMLWPGQYHLSTTLQVYSRSGLRIISLCQPDTNGQGQCGTEFNWTGTTAGAVATLNFNWAHACSLEGVAFTFAPGSTPPACAVRVDQWVDTTQPNAGAHAITSTTQCRFSRCLVVAPSTPGFIDFNFGQVSGNNDDLMSIEFCTCVGGAEGIRVGAPSNPSANLKGYLVNRCVFTGCGYGIHFFSGSASIYDCTATACGVAATATTPASGGDVFNEAIVNYFNLRGWNSEACQGACALSFIGTSASAEAYSCRFAAMTCASVLNVRMTTPGANAYFGGCFFAAQNATVGGGMNFVQPNARNATNVTFSNSRWTGIPLWNGLPVPAGTAAGIQQFASCQFINGSSGS